MTLKSGLVQCRGRSSKRVDRAREERRGAGNSGSSEQGRGSQVPLKKPRVPKNFSLYGSYLSIFSLVNIETDKNVKY